MRRPLTVALFLVVALPAAQFPAPRAAASTRQAKQSRGKVTPKRATPATKKDAKVAPASAERVSPSPQGGGPRLVVQLGQRTSRYGFAAFSRDGRLAATGGGGDVVVWDVATGREVRRFVGNEGDPGAQDLDGLTGGAFSPDNKLMAVAAGPNLRLWNLETGRLVWRRADEANAFLIQEESHPAVAFTPDGREVYVRGDAARLAWDVATGKNVSRSTLKKTRGADGVTEAEMLARRVTAHGAFVVEAGDGALGVTERATGRQLGRVRYAEAGAVEENSYGLLAFALSPDARLLLTAVKVGDEGEAEAVRLWDVRTGEEVRELVGRRPSEAGALRFTSEGGLLAVSADGEIIRARDLSSGRAVEWTTDGVPAWVEVSADGRFVVTAAGRAGQVWDARTGAQLARVEGELKAGEDAAEFKWDFAGFTPDETVTFHEEGTSENDPGQTVRLCPGDWKEKRVNGLGTLTYVTSDGGGKGFVMNRDSRAAAWETIVSEDDKPNRHLVTVWNADPKVKNKTFEVDRDEAYGDASGLALSPDGRKIVVVTANAGGNLAQSLAKVWDADAKRALFNLDAPGFRVGSAVAWSPDGRTIATGADDGSVVLWDAATGKASKRLARLLASANRVEFSADGRLLMASSGEGLRVLLDAESGAEVCRLVTFADGGWIVVDPQGRFDADDLADMSGAHWVAPDDPLRPLPLEIFMRDYYEPRLLARLLAGERFAPVRALAELNRVQPLVNVASVEQHKERPELVNVTIEVGKGVGATNRGAQEVRREAGVHDLRLFRDGQLVGHAPANSGVAGGEVKTDPQTGRATITFKDIRLPRRAGLKQVEFTAYAFNEDRVKSETARRTLRLAAAPAPAKGRAYVVSVGVNAYENEKWDLRFAANDARRLQEVVSARVAASGEYAEIVRVPLVSDYELKDGKKTAPRVLTEATATKANFKTVLDLLAGREVGETARRSVPNAGQLRKAAPEDLVIVSFSSHGYADERGNFYLLPSDTGAGTEMRDVLPRAVSSDELSLWLREVDAGELVLVVDACHSAASVQGAGFKPGPMGSRGLGQLSYDKGMRVLTSTQADNVALETNLTEQGLLTFALTREGLEAARADFSPPDGEITVAEWLAYGVERVPLLFDEVGHRLAEMQAGRSAELSREGGGTRVVLLAPGTQSNGDKGRRELGLAALADKTQRPSLFDYARGRRASVLSRK